MRNFDVLKALWALTCNKAKDTAFVATVLPTDTGVEFDASDEAFKDRLSQTLSWHELCTTVFGLPRSWGMLEHGGDMVSAARLVEVQASVGDEYKPTAPVALINMWIEGIVFKLGRLDELGRNDLANVLATKLDTARSKARIAWMRLIETQADELLGEDENLEDQDLGFEGRGSWSGISYRLGARRNLYEGGVYDGGEVEVAGGFIAYSGKFKSDKKYLPRYISERASELVVAAEEGSNSVQVRKTAAGDYLVAGSISGHDVTVRIDADAGFNLEKGWVKAGALFTAYGLNGPDGLRNGALQFLTTPALIEKAKGFMGERVCTLEPVTIDIVDKDWVNADKHAAMIRLHDELIKTAAGRNSRTFKNLVNDLNMVDYQILSNAAVRGSKGEKTNATNRYDWIALERGVSRGIAHKLVSDGLCFGVIYGVKEIPKGAIKAKLTLVEDTASKKYAVGVEVLEVGVTVVEPDMKKCPVLKDRASGEVLAEFIENLGWEVYTKASVGSWLGRSLNMHTTKKVDAWKDAATVTALKQELVAANA